MRLLFGLTTLCFLLLVGSVNAHTLGIVGTYRVVTHATGGPAAPGTYYATFHIDAFNPTTGAIRGHGSQGAYALTITGSVKGSTLVMQVTSPALGYTADDKGTIAPDGNISGTLTDTNGSTGRWTMTRLPTLSAGDLTVNVTGSGVVHLSGGRQVACKGSCRQTFTVRAGSRVVISTSPTTGWKFTAWAGACEGATPKCVLLLKRTSNVGVTFVPPGARENPILVGRAGPVGNGWNLTVNSVTTNANDQIVGVTDNYGEHPNQPPPAGAQDFMANITLTYTGGGSANAFDNVLDNLQAEGSHKAPYDYYSCGVPPAPNFESVSGDLFSGQSITGNVCFQVALNDVDTLLVTLDEVTPVWWALG